MRATYHALVAPGTWLSILASFVTSAARMGRRRLGRSDRYLGKDEGGVQGEEEQERSVLELTEVDVMSVV